MDVCMLCGTVAFGTHLCENPLEPDWREPNFLPSPIDDVGCGWGGKKEDVVVATREGDSKEGLLLKWAGQWHGNGTWHPIIKLLGNVFRMLMV